MAGSGDGWANGVFRSNWSEMIGHAHHNQHQYLGTKSRCADFEMNALECMEAYGYYRGIKTCKDYIDDWNECVSSQKQVIHPFFFLIIVSFSLSFAYLIKLIF